MATQKPRVKLLPPYPTIPVGDSHNQFMNIYLWGTGIDTDLAQLSAGLSGLMTRVNSIQPGSSSTGFTGTVTLSATDAFTVLNGAIQSVIPGGGGSGITQLTGDVTAGPGSGSQVATIPNGTVTYAKMQDVSAASKLLGRGDSGSGDVQEISLGSNLSMSGTTLSATGFSGVVVAAAGALDGDGTGGDPLTVLVDGVTIDINGSNELEAVFGGGGNVTYATAYGSEPAAAEGDLDLYTNSPQVARYDGADWIPYGPTWDFTPPVDGDYSWINQGSASVSTTYGGVLLQAPQLAGDSWKIRYKTAPSTPYYVVVAFIPHITENNHNRVGVGWRQSSDGKLVGATMKASNWETTKMNSATSFNTSSTWTGVGSFYFGNLIWMQFADDGTNRLAYLSRNGITWTKAYSEGRTTFMTADQVLFYCDANNGNYGTAMLLLHWLESASFQGILMST